MTPDRCSDRPKVKRLGGRDATACAATAVDVPAQGRDGEFHAMPIDPTSGGRGEWHQTAVLNAPRAHGHETQVHSMPIAPATGGDLMSVSCPE
jgi:hypothetical protein